MREIRSHGSGQSYTQCLRAKLACEERWRSSSSNIATSIFKCESHVRKARCKSSMPGTLLQLKTPAFLRSQTARRYGQERLARERDMTGWVREVAQHHAREGLSRIASCAASCTALAQRRAQHRVQHHACAARRDIDALTLLSHLQRASCQSLLTVFLCFQGHIKPYTIWGPLSGYFFGGGGGHNHNVLDLPVGPLQVPGGVTIADPVHLQGAPEIGKPANVPISYVSKRVSI